MGLEDEYERGWEDGVKHGYEVAQDDYPDIMGLLLSWLIAFACGLAVMGLAWLLIGS